MSKAIPMSTTKPATKPTATPTEKVLEAKWGKTLIAAGFTALPDVIFQYQKALKLKPLDVLVLLHLASYWWKPNENPWPAKGTIADAIDVDPRTVQRSIAKMEALGYVKRIERKAKAGDNLTNQYDLRGLVKAAATFADLKIAIREKRAAEDKSRRATPTAFALIEGGKRSTRQCTNPISAETLGGGLPAFRRSAGPDRAAHRLGPHPAATGLFSAAAAPGRRARRRQNCFR